MCITDQTECNVLINMVAIQAKAKTLYDDFQKIEGTTDEKKKFFASKP